ncbi:MAG: hypothetical protein WC010_04420 [Candidatus Absconditabacterales bacterium]
MKSSNLQKKFAKEYERFFLHNNLVVSVPQIIHRGNIFDKKNVFPQIKQKTSSKMFLGINTDSNLTDITFNDITYFSSLQKQFITVPLKTIFADIDDAYFKGCIASKLAELCYKKGMEINILSENERGSGIEFCGIIPVLLSAAIHALAETATIDQLNGINRLENAQIFENISTTALQLFPRAELDNYGAITYTAMTNHRLPTLSQKMANKTGVKNINVQEAFHIKRKDNQPMIDYGILSFGSSYDEHYINHLSKTQESIKEIGCHLNEALAKARENILKSEYDEQKIDSFIKAVQQQGLFGICIENHHAVFTDIAFLFNQSKQFQDEKIGVMPLTSAKYGGSFLFVTKYKKSRETIERLLEKLQEIGHKTAFYQYLSRNDGLINDGVKIEQYIDKDLFSLHIKDNNAILECYTGQKTIGNHRKLLDQIDNSIVFDAIDGKIYINNEPTNHHEIITQSGTIEIIRKLIENPGEYINNSRFPPSSYSKNKNEMVGKVIGPLQELVQKTFHEKLELKCSGNIVDFDLCLNPNNINIHLLKKIH